MNILNTRKIYDIVTRDIKRDGKCEVTLNIIYNTIELLEYRMKEIYVKQFMNNNYEPSLFEKGIKKYNGENIISRIEIDDLDTSPNKQIINVNNSYLDFDKLYSRGVVSLSVKLLEDTEIIINDFHYCEYANHLVSSNFAISGECLICKNKEIIKKYMDHIMTLLVEQSRMQKTHEKKYCIMYVINEISNNINNFDIIKFVLNNIVTIIYDMMINRLFYRNLNMHNVNIVPDIIDISKKNENEILCEITDLNDVIIILNDDATYTPHGYKMGKIINNKYYKNINN